MEITTQHEPGMQQTMGALPSTLQLDLMTVENVDRLNQNARDILETDITQAQTLSETSLLIAMQIGYRTGEATSRTRLAWLAYLRGDFKTALTEAGRAEHLALAENHIYILCNTLYVMSLPHDVVSNYAEAFDLRLRMLELARTHQLLSMEFRSLTAIGWQYQRLEKYSLALEAYEKALELSRKIDQLSTSVLKNNLASVYVRLNEPNRAIELCTEALSECSTENVRFRASFYHTLGQAYACSGNFEQALHQLDTAHSLCVSASGQLGLEAQIEIQIDTANIHLKLNNNQPAQALAQAALELATQLKSQSLQVLAHQTISRCSAQMGDFESALIHSEQAADIKLVDMRNNRGQRLLTLQVTHGLSEEKRAAELRAFKLEQAVQEKAAAMEQAQIDMVNRLVNASESRHAEPEGHIERVSAIAVALAEAIELPADVVDCLRQASRLHDIGTLTLPDRFFIPGKKLKNRQRVRMQCHATAGAQLLHGSPSRILQMGEEIAISHHERWDGRGFPHQLAAEAIPIAGRIVALAHAFDELLGPHESALRQTIALQKVVEESGKRFDPTLIAALARLVLSGGFLTTPIA